MKSYIKVVVALALAVASCQLLAAEIKIGLVDMRVLGQESLYAKSVGERMRKEFASREEAIVSKERELKSRLESLERDKDVLSESERTKIEKELTKMQQSLQSEGESFQKDAMARQEKENAAFEKVLSKVLADIAKEEKLDLILQQQVALYNGGKADYTYKALQALDKTYKDTNKK